ncbi:SrfA family protein [Yersinia proxima]|uniref:SrfA family protein n=1 Tax=Yersinia proxima TaxID=2890316 RepID=UPI001D128707|nr:SrfA family protein [Yersinia proxima]
MAKIILRSGYLDDFIALGENGQTIFDSALQIRETLRLRKQQHILDCLALPQHNDVEDKVDWYSPLNGIVTPWVSASIEQRKQALCYLDNCLITASAISQRCLQAEKTSLQLFGSLLTKVFQFPASSHIYLIDGKPVITFWGFVNLHHSAREDVFECLRQCAPLEPDIAQLAEQPTETEKEDDDDTLGDPEPVIVTLSKSQIPQPQPVAPIVADEATPEVAPPQPQKLLPAWSRTLRKVRLVIMLMVILFVAMPVVHPYLTKILPSLFSQEQTPPIPVIEQPSREPMITLTHSLPLQPAQVIPAPVVIPVAIPKAPEVPKEAIKNALVLPPNAVKAGSTKFLTGIWRATIDVKDPITGKPPSLRYQINSNNTGTVRTMHGDNITCKSDVEVGLMQSGNLIIKSRGQAKCSDGSRYPLPEITCTQGLSGPAQCTGRYDGDTVVPVTLIKVSK